MRYPATSLFLSCNTNIGVARKSWKSVVQEQTVLQKKTGISHVFVAPLHILFFSESPYVISQQQQRQQQCRNIDSSSQNPGTHFYSSYISPMHGAIALPSFASLGVPYLVFFRSSFKCAIIQEVSPKFYELEPDLTLPYLTSPHLN